MNSPFDLRLQYLDIDNFDFHFLFCFSRFHAKLILNYPRLNSQFSLGCCYLKVLKLSKKELTQTQRTEKGSLGSLNFDSLLYSSSSQLAIQNYSNKNRPHNIHNNYQSQRGDNTSYTELYDLFFEFPCLAVLKWQFWAESYLLIFNRLRFIRLPSAEWTGRFIIITLYESLFT